MSPKRKVFCVGFQKTGTTSLGSALEVLGYRVCGAVGCWLPDIAEQALSIARRISPGYDAFEDNPWPLVYREMDRQWSGSRFILTIREEADWLASMRRYFTGPAAPMEEWLYGKGGVTAASDARLLEVLNRHNNSVLSYFVGRRDRLCVLGGQRPFRWQPLCDLLGVPVPHVAFPHVNVGTNRADPPVGLLTPQPILAYPGPARPRPTRPRGSR